MHNRKRPKLTRGNIYCPATKVIKVADHTREYTLYAYGPGADFCCMPSG